MIIGVGRNNMIIVAGWARTGTSIVFRCLQESGLYGGEQSQLAGFPQKTELIDYRICNFHIMYYMGFKPLITKDLKDQKIRVVDDFFSETPASKRTLPYGVKERMSALLYTIKRDGIQILKDPQLAFAIKEWLKFDEMFANAKYIWCRRDPLETAKSCIRLKIPRFPNYRGVLTTRRALKTYELHDKIWQETLSNLSHIEVHLEHLVLDPQAEGERISEFIGVPFDTSLVTEKETYAGGNKFRFKPGTTATDLEKLRPVGTL
jgi:hypothetical protein